MDASEREELIADLSAYLDGELDEARRAEVDALLRESEPARALLAELKSVSRGLAALPRMRAPRRVAERIDGELRRRALRMRDAAGLLRLGVRLTGAAALIAVGVFVGRFSLQPEGAGPAAAPLVDALQAPEFARSEPRIVSKELDTARDGFEGKGAGPVDRLAGVTSADELSPAEDRAAVAPADGDVRIVDANTDSATLGEETRLGFAGTAGETDAPSAPAETDESGEGRWVIMPDVGIAYTTVTTPPVSMRASYALAEPPPREVLVLVHPQTSEQYRSAVGRVREAGVGTSFGVDFALAGELSIGRRVEADRAGESSFSDAVVYAFDRHVSTSQLERTIEQLHSAVQTDVYVELYSDMRSGYAFGPPSWAQPTEGRESTIAEGVAANKPQRETEEAGESPELAAPAADDRPPVPGAADRAGVRRGVFDAPAAEKRKSSTDARGGGRGNLEEGQERLRQQVASQPARPDAGAGRAGEGGIGEQLAREGRERGRRFDHTARRAPTLPPPGFVGPPAERESAPAGAASVGGAFAPAPSSQPMAGLPVTTTRGPDEPLVRLRVIILPPVSLTLPAPAAQRIPSTQPAATQPSPPERAPPRP